MRAGPDLYHCALPAPLAGTWCDLRLLAPDMPTGAMGGLWAGILRIDLFDPDDQGPPVSPLLSREGWTVLAFIPADGVGLTLQLYVPHLGQEVPMPPLVTISVRSQSRGRAARWLVGQHFWFLAGSLTRTVMHNPLGLVAQFRQDMRMLAVQPRVLPFRVWVRLFDQWTAEDRARLLPADPSQPRLGIAVLVLHDDAKGNPLRATLDSIASGWRDDLAIHALRRDDGAGLRSALATGPEYIALLEAGELVPPHALALLAHVVAQDQPSPTRRPDALYADEDVVAPDGGRDIPLFKPPPGPAAMLSAMPCTGVWLIRRTVLAEVLQSQPANDHAWAEALRLSTWLRLREIGETGRIRHVPHILTHRRADTALAPAGVLAGLIRSHIVRAGLEAEVQATRPLRMRFHAPPSSQQRVSLIIPTACQSRHVAKYISAVLRGTAYADLDVVIVISGNQELNVTQREILAPLEADRRVRVVRVHEERFNYARANNIAVATCDSQLICLLNDDVAPDEPDWLAVMVGHLSDPDIGVVGALLNYPDQTVQHAGVILLPDGTGEHLHRSLRCPAGTLPPQVISQDVSAVTGACLLTRRSVWDRLGGLDEHFSTAFNDVDYCLRAHEIGERVVVAVDARLTHAESATFGTHYGPDEQARNRSDRRRLLDRFPEAFRSDPYHSPNLSAQFRDCASPAMPPRVVRPAT